MKLRSWMALLALLALVGKANAASEAAWGQPFRASPQSHPIMLVAPGDTTADPWQTAGNGSGKVTLTNSDQTFGKKWQSIIQNSLFRTGAYQAAPTTATFAVPQSDSSSAKDMIGCNHMALAIYYTLDDSVSTAILALEIRGHYTQNIDSVSTFPWRGWGTHTLTALAVKDTVGSMTDPQTVLQGGSIMTDSTNCAPTERPIILNQVNPEHRHLWVPLSNDRGEWFSAPYVSVRARILKTYGASGVALTGKASPKTFVNIDLVGWR